MVKELYDLKYGSGLWSLESIVTVNIIVEAEEIFQIFLKTPPNANLW